MTSQEAPNVEVKMKIIEAAAAPYEEALPISLAALAFIARRENPPPRNMAMAWTVAPQNKVFRRPMRSRVNTQMRVANWIDVSQGILGNANDIPCKRCC